MELAAKVAELNGRLCYEDNVPFDEAIHLLAEVGLPKHIDREFLDDHGSLDLVYLQDKLVGYGYVMCSHLEIIEIHPDHQRQGICTRTLLDWFAGAEEFSFFMTNDAIVALMERLGEVHIRDDGFGICVLKDEWKEHALTT